jgi:DNA-binding SARP family transcriptional activator
MQAGFHNAKLAIRKALGKPAMSYVNGTYVIHPDLDYLYDVDSFTSQIAAASELAPEDALELLVDALKLYQDDFLTDFDSEWVADIRNRLQMSYAECCLKLGELALRIGVPHRAIELISEAAQRDELNEDIARLLMTLQLNANKRRAALDTYVRLSAALEQHLGIQPEPQTEMLAASIRANSVIS